MIKNCLKLLEKNLIPCLMRSNQFVDPRSISYLAKHVPTTHNLANPWQNSTRLKSKKNSKKPETDSESDFSDDHADEIQDKNTKIMSIKVTSMRVDAILKSALGIARNKVETLFYESKIRVNGEKIGKKSVTVGEGDEIDLIKGPDLKNPNFINVARVEVLGVKGLEETIAVKIRRCKSLSIESYDQR